MLEVLTDEAGPVGSAGQRSGSELRALAAVDHGFRPDIEGLRAIAVLAVLAYHAGLGPFHGGYVGVDVFFVLSGFLITSVLVRGLVLAGAQSLPGFWARRVRRLLPASTLVIVSTLIAARFLLDPIGRRALGHDAVDAALFVVNLVFIHRQNDYLAAQLAPSPLLHFWSLAVEEQFYVVWPFLLLAATRARHHIRLATGLAIAACAAPSFAASVWYTSHSQPLAFFSLPTRAWELLGGAALALVGRDLARVPGSIRIAAGWLGLGAVALSMLRFGDRTVFPGWVAALPVVATILVVGSGVVPQRGTSATLLGWAPLQWVGRRSYAIYLLHWPALTLAAARFGPLHAWQRAVAIGVAFVLAAVLFQLVEDPMRRAKWPIASSRRGLLLGGALVTTSIVAALVVLAEPVGTHGGGVAAPVTLAVLSHAGTTSPATDATTTSDNGAIRTAVNSVTPAAGPATQPGTTSLATTSPSSMAATGDTAAAAATLTGGGSALAQLVAQNAGGVAAGLATTAVPSNLRPGILQASGDTPILYRDGCILNDGVTALSDCAFGDPTSSTTVVLFGDSHAAQWFPAIDAVARTHRWRLEVLTKKGCPTAALELQNQQRNRECAPWRILVSRRLAAEHPALIVMSAYRYKLAGPDAALDPDEAWRRGLDVTLSMLRPTTARLLILGDTPTPKSDIPTCLAAHLRDVTACVNPRSRAVKPTRLAVEARIAAAHDAAFVTTSDWLCTNTACPVIIGNLLMYRDNSHLTTAAASWLTPYIDAALTPLMP